MDEVAQHLEDLFRELRSGGAETEEAYQQAMAELDDLYPLRAGLERNQRMPKNDVLRAGESSQGNFVEDLWKDFRYAIRSMRKNPVFVLFVVLTLALGIGANTTVFTLINTVVLNPSPVRNSDELAAVAGSDAKNTSKSGAFFPISYADLRDYQSRNQVFSSLAGFSSPRGMTWQEHGASQEMFGELVTDNYFSTLGLSPARGRFFSPEENSVPGAHPVAILNYAAWQKRFGGAENIVGQELLLNSIAFSVIGVAPPHFIGGERHLRSRCVGAGNHGGAPVSQLSDAKRAHRPRQGGLPWAWAHRRPNVTAAQAGANISTVASALAQSYPATNEFHTATVRPLREILLAPAAAARPLRCCSPAPRS